MDQMSSVINDSQYGNISAEVETTGFTLSGEKNSSFFVNCFFLFHEITVHNTVADFTFIYVE